MIIVDSNIFIFGETVEAPEREMAMARYGEAIEKGSVGVNVIILSEVFHKSRLIGGREGAALRIRDILNEPAMELLELTAETIMRAANLARDFQMRINDALIAQQAIETGASILTDNVKDFRKIRSIKIIPLRNGSASAEQ
ncbi:MAG TPA: type II toxin-antitoxin system VapC family toxin [Candidatus Acidoferrales bacterium]|nr:type II toxin-antitoxin system VapC family toxin [Candidatus Acidoferrales bacterium]